LPTLFSYVVRDDAGSAPNPFWDVCTLVICKPKIRLKAEVGDWIAGTGSSRSPVGNIQDKLVYAMRVTEKMTMREYDDWAREERPEKIPDWRGNDWRRKLGDAVYDFGELPPRVRKGGPHGLEHREHDLKGEYALLSEHSFYFGNAPVALPDHLLGIIKHGPGHRSRDNAPYLEPFVEWIGGLDLEPNRLHGKPQKMLLPSASGLSIGRKPRNSHRICLGGR
jgi:hypothetical protein